MKQIGFFVVGEGKFGQKNFGEIFQTESDTSNYWKNRGYELVPVYVNEEDFDNFGE